ncbi:MAG: T9SS type A sorting domain-containing protein [Bacteroidetes bacterium]|nr:T9SS type A sorting domain-containing protein [Bacteroidota bacterium]
MKAIAYWLAILISNILIPHTLISQTLTPKQSRQIQFIWEQSQVEYLGPDQSETDSIFEVMAHEFQCTSLAIKSRLSALPEEWAEIASISNENSTNILSSSNHLRPGIRNFMIPKMAVPTEWHEASWQIVFDGTAWDIQFDEPFQYKVSDTAECMIVGIVVSGNDLQFERHLLLPIVGTSNCPEPDPTPWPSENNNDPHWVGTFSDGLPITGQALVRLGEDEVFDRPVILLEGFDPDLAGHFPNYGFGDMNWDVLWNCDGDNNGMLDGISLMLDSILLEGLDLVFLDFSIGTHSIFDQAQLLKHVIELCRNNKEGDEPLVVIGPSMGGVVARLAIRQLELDGIQHCIRLLACIDSPFRGAHLPQSLQEAIAFFAEFSAEANDLHEALLSPAASELLVASPFHSSSIRTEIENIQNAQGLPQFPICLSVANSNPLVPFDTPDLWYSANESFMMWDYVNLNLWSQPGFEEHDESQESSWVIFEGQVLNNDWNFGEPLQYEGLAWCPSNSLVYEELPGSISAHMGLFNSALEQAGIEAVASTDLSMFIPCHSALDVPLNESFDSNAITFEFWQTESSENGSAFHCDIQNHLDLLWNAIVEGQPQPRPTADEEFSDLIMLGWSAPFCQTLNPFDDGYSTIEIGTSQSNGPGFWTSFQASTNPCASPILINENQQLLIGDTAGPNAAQLQLPPNTSFELHGDIHIGPNSSLTIESNATLELVNGKIHIHPTGELIQKPNGKISVQGKSTIHLNGSASKWSMQGDLIVNNGDTLQIHSGEYENAGVWEWSSTYAYTFIGQDGLLKYNSNENNATGEIVLQQNSGHLIEGPGNFALNRCSVYLMSNSSFELNAKASFNQTNFKGTNDTNQFHSNDRLSWNIGQIEDCQLRFENGSIAAVKLHQLNCQNTALDVYSTGLRVYDCDFMNSFISAETSEENSFIKLSTFHSGLENQAQLEILSSENPFLLEDNSFANHTIGVRMQDAKVELDCNSFEDLAIAIQSENQSNIIASSPHGMNYWNQNGIHVYCQNSNVPDFNGGRNFMNHADDAFFLGSILVDSILFTSTNAPVIFQNENQWNGSVEGISMIIPYTGLYDVNTGMEVIFEDTTTVHGSCGTLDIPEQETISKKNCEPDVHYQDLDELNDEWVIYPNPAQELVNILPSEEFQANTFQIVIRSTNGQVVIQRIQTFTNDVIEIDLSQLASGSYHLEILNSSNETMHSGTLIKQP